MRAPRFLHALPVLMACLLSLPLSAQEDVRTLTSPAPADQGGFGRAVAAVPDLNADGVQDLLVTEPLAGRAYVFSGAADELLLTLEGPNGAFGGDRGSVGGYGSAASAVPDTDGDGLADLLIGAPNEVIGGRAYLYSGATGLLLHTLTSPNATEGIVGFGQAVAGIDDLDGDGRGDLLIGAFVERRGDDFAGRAYAFSGATGQPLLVLDSPTPKNGGRFGYAVAAVPDVDGDGLDDILIGAEDEGGSATSSPGQVHLFSGASGTLLRTIENPSDQNTNFGWSVAGLPDITGDGRGDLIVGDNTYEDDGRPGFNEGRAYLIDGASGSVRTTLDPPEGDSFGRTVSGLPDADGDGVVDVLVAAIIQGVRTGVVYAFSGRTGGLIQSFASPNPEGNDNFGIAVAGVEDLDGDGEGEVLVGANGESIGGIRRLGRAYLFGVGPSAFAVQAPAEDEIVPPGQPYTVQFSAPGIDAVDLYLVTNSQDADGTRMLLAEDVPAADGTYAWEVDETLLSPSTFLIAVNAADPSEEVVSERFRVRVPTLLHRVAGTVAEPTYEFVDPDEDIWAYPQIDANFWPVSYWSKSERFYNGFPDFGRDPNYANPEVRYLPLGFPDVESYWHTPWTAWVDAFGTDATYASLDPLSVPGFEALVNQPDLNAFVAWLDELNRGYGKTIGEAADDSYSGACFGLTNAVLAAFADPDRFTAAWLPSLDGGNLADVPLSDEVRDMAHALQNRTDDERFERSSDNQQVFSPPTSSFPATPRKVLEEVKAMLARDERDLDRVVWFEGRVDRVDSFGNPARASHAVAPFELVDAETIDGVDPGERGDGRYALVIYDPNLGYRAMPIDSTANSWGPYSIWFGDVGRGLFVGPEVNDIYDVGNPPWQSRPASASERATSPDFVSVHVAGRSSAVVAPGGDRLAFEQGVLTETLDQAYTRFPITGVPSRPESYRVPRGAYSAEVTPDEGGFARLSVDWGRLRLGVERTDGLPEARDAFAIDPAGTATLTSAGGEVRLRALTTVGAGEARLFVADSLAVGAGTEARLAMTADSSAFALGGLAEAATYDLTLAVSVPGVGSRSFYHADVALPAGATHTVRPTWPTLGDDDVTIDVDTDGDGDPDETLVLPNEGLPVSSEEEASTLPAVFALGAYPNPTAGPTTIEVALPEATDVRTEVYDLLGRRVALLHDGPLAAGTHPLRLDASRLPAGVYVVRAVTSEATLTRRLTVVR